MVVVVVKVIMEMVMIVLWLCWWYVCVRVGEGGGEAFNEWVGDARERTCFPAPQCVGFTRQPLPASVPSFTERCEVGREPHGISSDRRGPLSLGGGGRREEGLTPL